MRQRSAFDRDFRDLHGPAPRSFDIGPSDYRVVRSRRRVDHIGLRLIVGFVGLVGLLVILALLVPAWIFLAGCIGALFGAG